MSKIKLNIKYCILGTAAGIAGFSLGQMHQVRNRINAKFEIHAIMQESYNITSVNRAKMQYLADEINMLQHIENKAVADSLQESITHDLDSIANKTFELLDKNEQRIQQIAKKNNINIK